MKPAHETHVAVVGAGLVGCLLSIYLRRRGYKVSVFERRPDMRRHDVDGGRSINLALSTRGIRALEEVGMGGLVAEAAIPMHGRMMHDVEGNLTFQPYGKSGQYINSISRGGLNIDLMNSAESQGVAFHFDQRCVKVDLDHTILTLVHNGKLREQTFDLIVGADGAFSAVRGAMQITDRFNYSQYYIEHGYKELHIPPAAGGGFMLEKNALHIWPRESFMLIALPNQDGSFTCTLFFPFDGSQSFNALRGRGDAEKFFERTFPDALRLMPSLGHDFQANPTSSLVTVKCFPWVRHRTLLIGDAAHAIVPFYGQGMNAGFEDCRILNTLLDKFDDNWDKVLPSFENMRKPDVDAIADLALANFVEMRDLVADADFLVRKKIEAKLHELYPDRWIPLYSMVTFHDEISYAEAQSIGSRQRRIMDDVMKQPGVMENWSSLDFAAIVSQL